MYPTQRLRNQQKCCLMYPSKLKENYMEKTAKRRKYFTTQGTVRINQNGQTLLTKLRAQFEAHQGRPVSAARSMELAFMIAVRTLDDNFMGLIAAGLNEKLARNTARLVGEITQQRDQGRAG